MLQNKSNQSLGFLDGVRGIAMMIVVFHHFAYGFFPTINTMNPEQIHLGNGGLELTLARTPLNLFFNGGFAVSLFFVLSGFVLSFKFHKTNQISILQTYALKRYFRLFLPVAVSIIVCYALHLFGFFYMKQTAEITKSTGWLGGLYNNMTKDGSVILNNLFYRVFFEFDNRYNPVLWTITIEFLGSILLFAFLALLGKNKRWLLFHILFIFVLFYMDRFFYASFIFGSLLSKLYVNGFSFPKGIASLLLKSALLLLGVYFSSYPQNTMIDSSIWAPMNLSWINGYEMFHVIGAFFILLVICFDHHLMRLFSIKPFLYLGKVSFSFYLLHLGIMCSFGCFLFLQVWQPGTYFLPFTIAFISSLALTFLVSHVYYLWIDKSGIRLANYIGEKFSK